MTDSAANDSAPHAAEPQSLLDRFGAALPVALTAIATAFAGLSTSELQQAMFWRSAAAQDQSQAANQWSLAGFKRDRSLIVQTTAAQLRAASGYTPPSFLASDTTTDPNVRAALEWLAGKGPPSAKLPEIKDDNVKGLLQAIQDREAEADLLKRAARISQATINSAIDDAEKANKQIDNEWTVILREAARVVDERTRITPDAHDRATAVIGATAAQAAGFDLENRRYRLEANLNFGIGYLYEARVKVSTAESDRHRERSKTFFYAMLAGQVGATISSLALARKHRSALWLLAGVSGVVAVAIGVYVYVGM
jgi:hypothetical protein